MDIHYNAFISYRHHPADIKVAEQIHKGLEHYRIPKTLKKKKDTKMRLFRDKEELPITSNLTDDITRALRNSDFLIVICSTHTKESIWVQREIETFLQTHDHSRILTVIVDGEPYDVIPEILCNEERIDPATGQKYLLPIEPLSCDWRAGKRKAYREELPRLAAALLGCGYDELRQRERQYRTRRMVTLFSVTLAAVLAFSAYVIHNSIQIQKANGQLEIANNQLESANNQLTDANIAIQNNLEQAQINQSQFLASAAQQQSEGGDRMLALALAMEALPQEDSQRPYVARAEKSLADAVQAYVAQDEIVAVGAITCDAFINLFEATDARDKMFVTDQRGILSVWDLEIFRQTAAIELEHHPSKLLVTPDDTVIAYGDFTLSCYDTGLNLLWQADQINEVCLSGDRSVVIAETNNNTIYLLDAATGDPIGENVQVLVDPEDLNRWNISFRQEFYDLEKPLLLDYTRYGEPSRIISVDLQNGAISELGSIPQGFEIRGTAYTEDGNALILATGENGSWNGLFNTMMTHSKVDIQIHCITPEGKTLWCTDLTSYTYTLEWHLFVIPGTNHVFCQVDNLLSVLDLATGEVLSCCETGATPIWVQPNEDHAVALLEDGSMGSYSYEGNEFNSTRYFKDNLANGFAGKGVFVKQIYSSEILVYASVSDENWQIFDGEYTSLSVHRAVYDDYVALYNYDSICVFDAQAQSLLWEIPEPSGRRYQLLEFTHDGKYLWISDNRESVIRLDMETGQTDNINLPQNPTQDISLYYSSYSRVCMADGVIYTLAQDLSTNLVYILALDTNTTEIDITPVEEVVLESYQDDCELLIARDGTVYVWFSGNGTVYQINTSTKDCSVFVDEQAAVPVIQYLNDENTYMVAKSGTVSFYKADGTLMFTDMPENEKGVSAYCTTQNEILLLMDSGNVIRYSPIGERLGDFGAHLYSSFTTNISSHFEPEEIRWIETGDGDLFLGIFDSGNLIDMACWESRAWIPNCIAYLTGTDQFVTIGQDEDNIERIGAFSRYTTEDIQQMAMDALSGYTLTQEQKDYYGIS